MKIARSKAASPTSVKSTRIHRNFEISPGSMSRRYLSVLFLSSMALAGQTAQNPLANSELKDPDRQKVRFKFKTLPNSVQIYTCKQANQGYAWSGPDPDAILTNDKETLIVHHYKGPSWEATDGSVVRSDAALARHFL